MKHKNKFSSQVRMATILIAFVTIVWISAQTVLSCSSPSSHTQTADSIDSNAIDIAKLLQVNTNPALQENIVEYSGMTVSFNPRLHIPNWVAWELTADETNGEEPRYDKFTCDENVPGCPDDWDYKYTGYDRGHMAPAADMKWNEQAMKESFFLTNICPQAPDLNRGSWKKTRREMPPPRKKRLLCHHNLRSNSYRRNKRIPRRQQSCRTSAFFQGYSLAIRRQKQRYRIHYA